MLCAYVWQCDYYEVPNLSEFKFSLFLIVAYNLNNYVKMSFMVLFYSADIWNYKSGGPDLGGSLSYGVVQET